MLNDPEFNKMIIYGLAGVCLVLLLAVIFLAVKRNIYYVDEKGREVPPPRKSYKLFADKKPEKAAAEEQEIEPEIEPEAEPEVIEEEPEVKPARKPFNPIQFIKDKIPVKKADTEEEPAVMEEVIAQKPAEEEPVIMPAEAILPEEPVFEEPVVTESDEDEEDVTKVMRFTLEPEPQELPEEEEPAVIEEPEPEPVHLINIDEEPEEEDIFAEEPPAPVIPKATGLTVTVTVGGQSETHEIDMLPCLIGRDQTSCNLVISEPAVSRRHARIYVNEDGLFIEDVSEHNGTYVNGTKLPSLGSAPLKEDDRISLGRAEIAVNRILY